MSVNLSMWRYHESRSMLKKTLRYLLYFLFQKLDFFKGGPRLGRVKYFGLLAFLLGIGMLTVAPAIHTHSSRFFKNHPFYKDISSYYNIYLII